MTQRGSRSTQKQMPPRILAEVLDRQPQPPRAGRAEHQPVAAPREVLVRQRLAEHLVVDAEVVAVDAASSGCRWCRRSRRRKTGLPARPFGNPAPHRPAAQPLVLEEAERLQVVEALDLAARIPVELAGELQPERAARRRIEMPRDDLTDPGIHFFLLFRRLHGAEV